MRVSTALLAGLLALTDRVIAEPVRVHYLGNMGVAISAGEDQVLIDALWDNDYDGRFARVPAPHIKAMRQAAPPFDQTDLILVTHIHGDHFADHWIAGHLRANPDAVFVAADQPLMLMPTGLQARYRDLKPAARGQLSLGAIELDWVALRHAGANWPHIANHAYRLRLGGKTIVHLGDAAARFDNFAASGLGGDAIDLLILPQWFFRSEEGRRIVTDALRPRQGLVTHLPTTFMIADRRYRPGGDDTDWIVVPDNFILADAPGTQIIELP